MTRPTFRPLIAALALAAGCAAAPPPETAPGQSPEAASLRSAPGSGEAPFNLLGRADAPVTIIEFSDLQCPHCARHAAQVLPELRRNYVDTGKVRYAALELPLPSHDQAFPAAVVARCAGEQGRYWEFREALFMERMRLGEETYAALARRFGLDEARLEACRRDGAQAEEVRADMALAARHGIRATPAFMIGRSSAGELPGEIVVGAKPYEAFAETIDALLAAPR